jgi:hypothetical protein
MMIALSLMIKVVPPFWKSRFAVVIYLISHSSYYHDLIIHLRLGEGKNQTAG